MTARLARRACWLGLTLVAAFYTAVFVFAFALSANVRLLGARASVDESPTQPLSIDFEVDPMWALAVWAAASLLSYAVLRRLAWRRSHP
jgi:hypothetical protein